MAIAIVKFSGGIGFGVVVFGVDVVSFARRCICGFL